MAGDWIKMRGNLWDDPRVASLVDATDTSEAAIVGGLYWLWATADQHSEDGCMPGLTLRQVDRKTGIPGFAQALCAIGWLRDDPQGVVIARFEEHNGASAKKRAATAKRVADHRAGNADVTPPALQDERASVTGALAREEKEKEKEKDISSADAEEKRSRSSRSIARPEGVPESVWTDFLAIRKAKKAPLTATALEGIEREARKAGISLAQALSECCSRGWQGFKADWLTSAPARAQAQGETAYQRSMRERAAEFAPLAVRTAPDSDPFADLALVDVIPSPLPPALIGAA